MENFSVRLKTLISCSNFIAPARGDVFGFACAPIVIFTLVFTMQCRADFDLALGSTFRTYPLSGVIEFDAGYDFLLWGVNAAGSPWYGYLRPHFDASSAGTYNTLGFALDLYPLSILGLRAGGEGIENDQNYSAYDCLNFDCRGRYSRTYAQGELTLGAGPVFLQGRVRRERWTERAGSLGAFIEPTAGLALAASGDSQTVYRGSLGVHTGANWTVLGAVVYTQSDTHGISRFPFALVRYALGGFSAGLGAGVFSSTLKVQGFSSLLFLRWEVKPSLALN